MSEIVEKGLMIGFGLIVVVIFFSSIQPFFNLFSLNELNSEDTQDLNEFSLIFKFGLNECLDKPKTNINYNCSLSEEITIYYQNNGLSNQIILSNGVENISITTSYDIYFSRYLLNNSFIMQFYFVPENNLIYINFKDIY